LAFGCRYVREGEQGPTSAGRQLPFELTAHIIAAYGRRAHRHEGLILRLRCEITLGQLGEIECRGCMERVEERLDGRLGGAGDEDVASREISLRLR
jgi:hypothetical protein